MLRLISQYLILSLALAFPAWAADLTVTQGDSVTFNLTLSSGAGVLHDLTGATFTTYIQGLNGKVEAFANSKHTAAPDQTADRGEVALALTTSDTALLGIGKDKEIVTKVVQGANTVYFHARKILDVLPADPIQ